MQEKRPTNGADGTNLVAPLPVITGIVRLAVCVMDGAAASRSIAKKIQSVTPLSVYACTIRRRFQQSGIPEKRPLLRLPWMETTGICTANGVMNGGHGQRNEMALCLLMNPTSVCNITRFGFELGDRMLNRCVMLRHTGPTPSIMV
ncbi:hypothetical protein TNCV_4267281 [Trichonephila clavipes]|nr:hypothetical protein TNCV_4267281 [Trichonephila clavipes]